MRQRRRRCVVCSGKGNPAVADCPQCRRPYCGMHQAFANGDLLCTKCAKRLEREGGDVLSPRRT